MENKYYAIVGTWYFKPAEKGLCVYSYDPDTAKMTFLKRYAPHVTAGQQHFDYSRNVLYVVDEVDGRPGEQAAGGYLCAYSMDPATGDLTPLNERCILMGKPSYVWVDKTHRYAMVSCHTGRNSVSKVVRMPDGTLKSQAVYDDVGVVLVRLNEDGSIGECVDAALYSGLTTLPNQVHAHLHSVMADPTGEIYYSCDKGLDMIYSYAIDYEHERIIRKAEQPMKFASAPRYLAFHPTLPVLYENNETDDTLYAFRYCKESGALTQVSAVPQAVSGDKLMPSDLLVSPNGKYLYSCVRGVNIICAYSIDQETGSLTAIETVPTGEGPRGLGISPDGRFLFSVDNFENTIHTFAIAEDGTLTKTDASVELPCCANIEIVKLRV